MIILIIIYIQKYIIVYYKDGTLSKRKVLKNTTMHIYKAPKHT